MQAERLRRSTSYLALALFAIAFGIEEAIVVLYLRVLPAQPAHMRVSSAAVPAIATDTYHLEIAREICTVIVLGVVATFAGAHGAQRFRNFLFAFGAWDIVYYVALWALSGHPGFTNGDVLFLIPVPWIGPVWAVMAFAAALMLLGLFGIAQRRGPILGVGLLLGWLSFVYASFRALLTGSAYDARFSAAATHYPIWIFVPALALVILALPLPLRPIRGASSSRPARKA